MSAYALTSIVNAVATFAGQARWHSLEHDARFLTFDKLQLFWGVACAVAREPDLGFIVAARFPLGAVKDIDDALAVAPTLGAAMETYRCFASVVDDDVRVSLDREGDTCWFTLHAPSEQHRASQDLRLARFTQIGRSLLCESVHPRSVCFAYEAPTCTASHQRAFGNATLSFGAPVPRLSFPTCWLDRPLPGADEARFREATARIESLRAERSDTRLSARVAAQIQSILVRPGPSLSTVADRLGSSERSVRRHLDRSGTSYRALLEEIRRAYAELYLSGHDVVSDELAERLGYANAGAFRRAFRRWTHSSVREYRDENELVYDVGA